jgi:hypothetical protein
VTIKKTGKHPASGATGLRFSARGLIYGHADLRISLRGLRTGQRSLGAFDRLEIREVSALRLGQVGEKIFHVRS